MPIVDVELSRLMATFELHVRDHTACGPCDGIGAILDWEGSTLIARECKPCFGTGWAKQNTKLN